MTTLTPIGGNPVQLAERARSLRASADLIQQAIDDLKKLADRDETISEAVDKVRDKSHDLAGNITKAQIRFKGTADALLEYSGHLQTAQSNAAAAISEYDSATHSTSSAQASFEHQSAQWAQDNNATYYPGMPDSHNGYLQTPQGVQAQHQLDEVNSAVRAAEQKWQTAINDLDTAAKKAIGLIDDAMDASGLKDGFWDKVGATLDAIGGWLKKNLGPILDVLQKIAEQIGNIAGFLAIVVGFLGIFFPALEVLAGALETIALVASLVSFALTAVLFMMGDRTLGDLVFTGITAVTAVVGLKLKAPIAGVAEKAGVAGGTKIAGASAVAAEKALGATYLEQAVIADAVAPGAEELVKGATDYGIHTGIDLVGDAVAENSASLVDNATGSERPEGLWADPIRLTPAILPDFANHGEYSGGITNLGEVKHGASEWGESITHATPQQIVGLGIASPVLSGVSLGFALSGHGAE
jgi:hypothetical protein